MTKQKNTPTRLLAEGALMIALSLALSYFRIRLFATGGSIDFVMIPLILFSVRWGSRWGIGAGIVFGMLKYFFAAGFAINWASIFLDYSIAFGAVGLAGLLRGRPYSLFWGSLAGCFARYAVHFISGVTLYAISGPTELFGQMFMNPWSFSLVYNLAYMLPSAIIAAAICLLLQKPLQPFLDRPRT